MHGKRCEWEPLHAGTGDLPPGNSTAFQRSEPTCRPEANERLDVVSGVDDRADLDPARAGAETQSGAAPRRTPAVGPGTPPDWHFQRTVSAFWRIGTTPAAAIVVLLT